MSLGSGIGKGMLYLKSNRIMNMLKKTLFIYLFIYLYLYWEKFSSGLNTVKHQLDEGVHWSSEKVTLLTFHIFSCLSEISPVAVSMHHIAYVIKINMRNPSSASRAQKQLS